MIAAGLVLLLSSMLLEHPHFELNAMSFAVMAWLVLFCSIAQFTLWFTLLRMGPPEKTSSYLFLVPLFAILIGWWILDETINWYVGVGATLIFISIYLVNRLPAKICIESNLPLPSQKADTTSRFVDRLDTVSPPDECQNGRQRLPSVLIFAENGSL